MAQGVLSSHTNCHLKLMVRLLNRHNKIGGDTLLAAANDVEGQHHRRILKLDLTFNFINGRVQQEIQRRYSRIAKSVVAPTLFPRMQ